MSSGEKDARTLLVLHGSFALTGVLHAIGGALLPSIALTFGMSDRQSGALFLLYFLGTAFGALLCIGRYTRLMTLGFILVAVSSIGISLSRVDGLLLRLLFFALGVGVSLPMSTVSMFAGRKFGERSAAPLTFLNFSWSAGGLAAPLFAAQVLLNHSYRAAYTALAVAAVISAAACGFLLEDPPAAQLRPGPPIRNVAWIALFASLTFLEVGIENTTATWLATFSMRTSGTGAALAAASSSLYWCGFLISRGLFSLALLRVDARRILRWAVLIAFAASLMLVVLPGPVERGFAMLTLGAALAPVFPLMLSRFFARASNSSDSRWVLSLCGFGGSVLPWLTGAISAASSLRFGLAIVPAALLVVTALLPLAYLRDPASPVSES